jgi:hypothetical protein
VDLSDSGGAPMIVCVRGNQDAFVHQRDRVINGIIKADAEFPG